MSTDSSNQRNHRPCRYLRSKEMFYDTGETPGEEHGSGLFWCEHTNQCLGPDGHPVADEDCGPERNCYQR